MPESFKFMQFRKINDIEDDDKEKISNKFYWLKCINIGIGKLALFILIALLMERTYGTVNHYLEYPTYFETRYVSQFYAQMPAITICPLIGYNESVLKKYGIESRRQYNYRTGKMIWKGNDTNVTEQDIFNMASYKFEDIVTSFTIRTVKTNENGKYSTHLNFTPALPQSMKEQRHRGFGKCYTFIARNDTKELGVYYIKIKFRLDAKVYYHAEDDFLAFNGRMGHKILLGQKVQAQIKIQDTMLLPRKIKKHGDVETKFSCKKYSYDKCMYENLYWRMKAATKDNCTVPWIPRNEKICKTDEDRKAAFITHFTRSTNQMDDCATKCHILSANVLGKNYESLKSMDYAVMYSYFSLDVEKRQEEYLYTIYRLTAEVGGYLGLFLGYSIYNVAEYIQGTIGKKIENMKPRT